MRIVLHLSAIVVVGVCATWAYRVNYATQEAANRVADLRREIAAERDALAMQHAEWAYLNRPDRLRALVQANPQLGLGDLAPEQFADAAMVAFPPEPDPLLAAAAGTAGTAGAPVPTPDPNPGGPRPRAASGVSR